MAASSAELLRTLGLVRPDVLGISMGGMVGLAMLAAHGDAVGRVVAVSASAGGDDAPQPEGGWDAVLR